MQGGHGFLERVQGEAFALLGAELRPLLLAFASCAGAAAYLTLPSEPPLVESLLAAAGLAGLLIAVRQLRRSDAFYTLLIILFGLAAGFAAGTLRAHSVQAPAVLSETRPVMLEGWITDIEPGQNGPRLRLKVHAIGGYAPEQVPAHVRLTHTSRLEVFSGRFVRCWAVLRPPPAPALPGDYDFRRQAHFDRLGAVGYVQGRCRGGVLGRPVKTLDQAGLWIASKRRLMAIHVNEAAGERAGGLAAALITGDRSFLRPEDQEAMRDTGLAHLLAISGLHLSIVGGLTYLIIRRGLALIEPLALRVPVQKPAALIALLVCAAYLVLSGASISTQRAFIMAAIVFSAVLFDRSALSLRTFSIAMLAVVFLWPESVVTPGFQMSFAATGALIAVYESWRLRRESQGRMLGPMGFAWASIVMTSVVSDAATSPYALYHFDRMSPVGLITNFAVMPVVTFVTAPLAALALILLPFGAGDIGLRLFGYSLELVLMLSHTFHDLSPGLLRVPVPMPAGTLVLMSIAVAAIILLNGWARLIAAVMLMIPAFYVWHSAPKLIVHWSASGAAFIADDVGYARRLTVLNGDGLSPLRFEQAPDLVLCQEYECTYEALRRAIVTIQSAPDYGEPIGPEPAISVQLANGETETLAWTDIAASGGISVYLQNDRLIIRRPIPCGHRIWAPCLPATAVPTLARS